MIDPAARPAKTEPARRVVDPVTQVEIVLSAGISAERAITHAQRERDGTLRHVRFFVDWGHPYPLWESGAGGAPMEPQDYGLSDHLARALHAWHTFWEAHCDPFDGWRDEGDRHRWLDRGDELAALLEVEVYDFAQVHRGFR